MREIFINGTALRYKTERDLSIILRHARDTQRLIPSLDLESEAKRRARLVNGIKALTANSLSCIVVD